MADTSNLTDQEIADAATAGSERIVVPAVTRTVVFADTTFTFSSINPQSGLRATIRNREFITDVALDDIAGVGSSFCITPEDKNALILILQKIHVGCVML